MIKVLIETCHGVGCTDVEYTKGADQFMRDYKVPYQDFGDFLSIEQPKGGVVVLTDGDEVTKDSLIALQTIAGKYNAVISLYAHGLTIEFLPELPQ